MLRWSRREVNEHTGMRKNEVRLRMLFDQARAVLHLTGKELEVEGETVVLEMAYILSDLGVHDLVG